MGVESWFDAIRECGKEARRREIERKERMMELVDETLNSSSPFKFKLKSLNEMRKEGILRDGEFFEILDSLLKD